MTIQRDESIDALKGLGILCIVLLHYSNTILPTWSYVWISRFMITIFYFTSGWLCSITKSTSLKDLFIKRLKTLGIPYVSFSILIICFDLIWLRVGFYDLNYILKDIYKFFVLRGIGTLWFLPALMGGEIIVLWLRKTNKKVVHVIILIITFIYVALYDTWLDKYRNLNYLYQIADAPMAFIAAVLRAWPVIFAGFLASSYFRTKNYYLNRIILIFWGFGISTISIFLCDYFVDMSVFKWYITPIIAPLGLLLIFKGLKNTILTKFFTYWGRNSLIVMATHYSIIQVICATICEKIYLKPFIGNVTLLFFIITLIIEIPIIYLFNTRMRFMLGR